jgi:NAD(P)-dependent dehydrogenase (short-subunit alcohol dehydrogenase family)
LTDRTSGIGQVTAPALADLLSQSAVRQLAQEFKGRYRQLHVLVNNAGAVFFSL